MTTPDLIKASRVSTSQIYQVLPEIAHQVASYWETAHHRACQSPCALLGEDRLTITLEDALTPLEAAHAATDDGYRALLATVQREIDGIYPQLATQVERHFHCYVGALQVAIIPARAAIRLELELRDPPAYLAGAAFESSCR
jgi:hypothetical protein